MRIHFKTNIDRYNEKGCDIVFPNLNDERGLIVPRKGEQISVRDTFVSYYRNLRLPTTLEVVNVTYTENLNHNIIVVCELWFRNHDLEMAKMQNINLLTL